jgi:hypothetical protein
MAPHGPETLRVALVSAMVLLAAAAGSLLYTETASVKLTVKPQSIEVIVTLAGGQSAGALPTQRFQASVTESQQGFASTVQVGAAYASGFVRFTYNCATNCVNANAVMPAGTVVTNPGSFGYATLGVATINASKGSAVVAVRATGLGASWNSAPETLTTIVSNNPYGHDLMVTNPSAISGGADGRLARVIQQSDYDVVRNALTDKVNNELGAALYANSKGSLYVGDSQVAYTVTSDHAVGDETPSFTIKVFGTVGATAFSESQANAMLLAALRAKVPPGQELTNDHVQFIFQGRQVVGPNPDVLVTGTDVLVTGKADGFVIPALTPQSLRSQVKGLSPAEAMRSIERTAPGSRVEIQVSPAGMPRLPYIADHIAVTVVVEPARQ